MQREVSADSPARQQLQIGAYCLVVRIEVRRATPEQKRDVPVVVLERHRAQSQIDIVSEPRRQLHRFLVLGPGPVVEVGSIGV